MSWERDCYQATCTACGRVGTVVLASDDWGRSETTYEGFGNIPPTEMAVRQGRVSSRDSIGICECGSSEIARGTHLWSR